MECIGLIVLLLLPLLCACVPTNGQWKASDFCHFVTVSEPRRNQGLGEKRTLIISSDLTSLLQNGILQSMTKALSARDIGSLRPSRLRE